MVDVSLETMEQTERRLRRMVTQARLDRDMPAAVARDVFAEVRSLVDG